MDSRARSCQGYRIIECCTIGDRELVIGYHPRAPSPYVCWCCKGGQSYYWGYYCNSIEATREKMDERYQPGSYMPYNSPTAQEWKAGAAVDVAPGLVGRKAEEGRIMVEGSTGKGPMTTSGMFETICRILQENGKMPGSILDYGLTTHSPAPITNCEFGIKSSLGYGGSEGIYLDLWLEHDVKGEGRIDSLGTFKTLRTDSRAMHAMAALLADFTIEAYAYANADLDRFTWEGVDVRPMDEPGEPCRWGYSCGTMEMALEKKDGLLFKYPEVVVRDNATGEEKVYVRGHKTPVR